MTLKTIINKIGGLSMLLLFCGVVNAKMIYGNEWFNENQNYYKIKISVNGFYKLDATFLKSVGLNSQSPASARIYLNGTQIPIQIGNKGDTSQFDGDDYIQFYGKMNDGTLDTSLYAFKFHQPNKRVSLYNDTSYYYLTFEQTSNQNLYQVFNNPINPKRIPETFFYQEVSRDFNSDFYAGRAQDAEHNFYSSEFSDGEGFLSPALTYVAGSTGYNVTFNTPNYDTAHGTPYVEIKLAGESDVSAAVLDHKMKVDVTADNGTSYNLGYISYDGYKTMIGRFKIPQSYIGATKTKITLTVMSDGVSGIDRQRISYVRIYYPRAFNFPAVRNEAFSYKNTSGDSIRFKIKNLVYKGSVKPRIYLFDLTNQMVFKPTYINDSLNFTVQNNTSLLDYYLLDSSYVNPITTIGKPKTFKKLSVVGGYDYLLISNNKLQKSAVEYQTYKKSQGFKVLLAFTDDLYDGYMYGYHHPVAIQRFIANVYHEGDVKPEYLMLLGKGYEYPDIKKSPSVYGRDLVPTIGQPCSDLLYVAGLKNDFDGPTANLTTDIAVGRLVALSDDSVRAYLDKLSQFESQNMVEWKKNIIHVSGGTPDVEAAISGYMHNYKDTIEGALVGANVEAYYNKIAALVNLTVKDQLQSWINNGASMYNYFGHGSTTVMGVDLGHPSELNNKNKYIFMCLNGCSIGNPAVDGATGEQFLMIKQKGAIGWLSHSALTFVSTLDDQASRFYSNLSHRAYGKSIGKAWQFTINDVDRDGLTDSLHRQMNYEWIFQGDPSIKFPFLDNLDLAVNKDSVSTYPFDLISKNDSIGFTFPIVNLGKVTNDSFDLKITRTYPSGNTDIISKRYPPISYKRDFLIYMKNDQSQSPQGSNSVEINIDPDFKLKESSKTNNIAKFNFYLQGNGVRLLWPNQFGIIGDTNSNLIFQSKDIFDTSSVITVQMDTSNKFSNKNLYFLSKAFPGSGLIKWNPFKEARFRKFLPILNTKKDTIVFYWRAKTTTPDGKVSNWETRSFTFIKGIPNGWANAHWQQFDGIKGQNISLDSNKRQFNFDNLASDITLSTHLTFRQGMGIIQSSSGLGSYTANVCGVSGLAEGRIVVMEFDAKTLQPVLGDVSTRNGRRKGFYTCLNGYFKPDNVNKTITLNGSVKNGSIFNYTIAYRQYNLAIQSRNESSIDSLQNPVKSADSFVKFINQVPKGNYVAVITRGSIQEFSKWSSAVIDAFKRIGSTAITTLTSNTKYDKNTEWVLLGKKGASASDVEEDFKYIPTPSIAGPSKKPADESELLIRDWRMKKPFDSGSYQSTLIGPAKKWKWAYQVYKHKETPSTDQDYMLIYGLNKYGIEKKLDSTGDLVLSLNNISADTFPYLRIVTHTNDTINKTPSQLRMWEVLYDGVPEGTFYADKNFKFYKPIMQKGDTLQLKIRFANISPYPMDSLAITYDVINSKGKFFTKNLMLPPVKKDSFVTLNIDTTTMSFPGDDYRLLVAANPNFRQPEQTLDNNFVRKPFKLNEDKTNPILDVTFDGRHISNSEIVSAKPLIYITSRDDNKTRLMSSRSLIKVLLRSPNSPNFDSIPQSSKEVVFYPATSGKNNKAALEYKPQNLQDGEYELKVQAYDVNLNKAGNFDYSIKFRVINKQMVSNIYTYPNPFSTKARFVFTLTGSEVPDYMKIQIMTITGRVVKEILKEDLGSLRIGDNITSYAWDGRDEFGDLLGNGLYLYRVITKHHDGSTVDKYETAGDKYFDKNIGKMYILR